MVITYCLLYLRREGAFACENDSSIILRDSGRERIMKFSINIRLSRLWSRHSIGISPIAPESGGGETWRRHRRRWRWRVPEMRVPRLKLLARSYARVSVLADRFAPLRHSAPLVKIFPGETSGSLYALSRIPATTTVSDNSILRMQSVTSFTTGLGNHKVSRAGQNRATRRE